MKRPFLRAFRPQLHLSVFISMFAVLLSCSDEGMEDPAPDNGTNHEPGPGDLICQPTDHRRCACEIGVGEQTCAPDGSAWNACGCPIKEIELAEGTTILDVDVPGTAYTSGQTIYMPLAGNERYLELGRGDAVVWLEGTGLVGRVLSVAQGGGVIAIEIEREEENTIIGNLRVNIEDTPINIDAYLPQEALSDGESEATTSFGSGMDFSKGAITLSLYAGVSADLSFRPGTTVYFRPVLDADLDTWARTFSIDGGLDMGVVLLPTLTVSGKGSAGLSVELISLVTRTPEPPKIPLGNGITAEVQINLGCVMAIDGTVKFEPEVSFGVDVTAGISYDDGFSSYASATPTSSVRLGEHAYTAGVTLTCSLKPKMQLNFLVVGYGNVEAGPSIVNRLEFGARHKLHVSANFNAKASVGVDLEVWEVSESLNLYNQSWWLYRRQFAFCGDGYRQNDTEQILEGPVRMLDSEECDAGPWADPLNACNDDCTANPDSGYEFISDPEQGEGYGDAGLRWGASYNKPRSKCRNGVLDPGEYCDDGYTGISCGSCAPDCSHRVGICGDGIVDWSCGEFCDDQNDDPCDGCHECKPSARCGNGVIDAQCGEICDDGNNPDNSCSDTCQARSGYCGDGIINYTGPNGTLDECDDGNQDPCDGCDGCKVVPVLPDTGCGDGYVCGAEACEPSVAGQDDANCNADCTLAACGDGYVNAAAGETCDGLSATCDDDCTAAVCGDRVVNILAGEDCDQGGIDTQICNADCTSYACGDGYLNPLREACDDGDTDSCATPGCNSDCSGPFVVFGVCGDGVAHTFCGIEACDDGSRNGTCGHCSADCQTPPTNVCGDGVVSSCETCDDGNTVGGDGCTADCSKIEICGDRWIDAGEVCDDGNNDSCMGPCKSDCSGLYPEVCGDNVIAGCEICERMDADNDGIDDGCDALSPNCNGCGRCSADVCGDGIVGRTEACDPRGTCYEEDTATCTLGDTSACTVAPSQPCSFNEFECAGSCTRIVTCGDNYVDGAEQCDDGDVINNDGCSSTCTIE